MMSAIGYKSLTRMNMEDTQWR